MMRYDSYKDSGVEWIGEIPSSWVKTKLKYKLQEVVTGGTPDTSNDSFWSDEDNGINWISISDITSNGREIKETKKFISEKGLESKKLQILPIGSLIYSIYGSIGKISRMGIPSTVHQGILVLRTNSTYNTTFLEYYLIYFKEYVSLFSSSNTQENLNQEKVSNFDIPVPPLSEQQQIVEFLDTKTELIDSLIQKTQRKIELLKEKRTSLINEVVTKGLNPNVEMKESGVEWIGEIPSHWDRVPFKYEIEILTDFTSNGSFKSLRENVEYLEGGYSRLVRLTDLRVNLENDGIFISEDSHNFLSKSELFGGEILISCVGHYTGFVTKMLFDKGKCSLGPNMYLIRNKIVSSDVDYLIYLLNSDLIQSGLKNGINKTTQEKINKDNVKDLQIVRPPLSEQQQIVEYLDEQTQLIDNTISIEEKRIELLKEYRQSLISEVVTGKRKVVK